MHYCNKIVRRNIILLQKILCQGLLFLRAIQFRLMVDNSYTQPFNQIQIAFYHMFIFHIFGTSMQQKTASCYAIAYSKFHPCQNHKEYMP